MEVAQPNCTPIRPDPKPGEINIFSPYLVHGERGLSVLVLLVLLFSLGALCCGLQATLLPYCCHTAAMTPFQHQDQKSEFVSAGGGSNPGVETRCSLEVRFCPVVDADSMPVLPPLMKLGAGTIW